MTRGGVCVVGSCNFDLVARVAHRPAAGETVLGSSFGMFLGGKGFNQAVAARRAGAETAMVSRIGDDEFGRRFLEHMGKERIDCEHVGVDGLAATGVGLPVIEDASGQNAIVVVPGANMALTPALVERAAPVIESAAITLLQLEIPIESVVEGARIAKAAGSLVVLNPAPAPARGLPADLLGLVDVLVPNEPEAVALLGSPADTGADLARGLVDRFGLRAAVVTLAEQGVALCEADGDAHELPAHEVACVDSVAAGDAFCGTLAAALASGLDLHDAVVRANAAGALAVTQEGAEPSLPAAADVTSFLAASPQRAARTAAR